MGFNCIQFLDILVLYSTKGGRLFLLSEEYRTAIHFYGVKQRFSTLALQSTAGPGTFLPRPALEARAVLPGLMSLLRLCMTTLLGGATGHSVQAQMAPCRNHLGMRSWGTEMCMRSLLLSGANCTYATPVSSVGKKNFPRTGPGSSKS